MSEPDDSRDVNAFNRWISAVEELYLTRKARYSMFTREYDSYIKMLPEYEQLLIEAKTSPRMANRITESMKNKKNRQKSFYPYLGFLYCDIVGLEAGEVISSHNSDEFFLNDLLLKYYIDKSNGK